MATYSLTGIGTQALTSGTGALYVTISALPAGSGNGGANPSDYYGIGTIRPGNATAFWEPFPIIGGPQWLPLPAGTTRIGYALYNSAGISVAEVAGSSPLAFPLASLPDVAIASVADAQVLAYQASTSKWINATPTGGGGEGTGVDVLLDDYSQSTDITTSISVNTFTTWVTRTITVTSATALIEVAVSGHLQAQTSCNAGSRLLIDGSTTKRLGGSFGSFPNCLAGAGPASLGSLSAASHTVAVQVVVDVATSVVCRPATRNAESLSIRIWQRG